MDDPCGAAANPCAAGTGRDVEAAGVVSCRTGGATVGGVTGFGAGVAGAATLGGAVETGRDGVTAESRRTGVATAGAETGAGLGTTAGRVVSCRAGVGATGVARTMPESAKWPGAGVTIRVDGATGADGRAAEAADGAGLG